MGKTEKINIKVTKEYRLKEFEYKLEYKKAALYALSVGY